MSAALWGSALALMLTAAGEPPAVCERVVLRARVATSLDRVEGTISCHLGPEAPQRLSILAFPDLLRTPRGLDDINRQWHYPDGFDPAAMALWHPADGRPIAIEAGRASIERSGNLVTVAFSTQVPRRHGPFARHRGALWLLGGWHPLFADPEHPDGAATAEIDYRLEVPGQTTGFVAGRPIVRAAGAQVLSSSGRFRGRFVPALIAPEIRVRRLSQSVVITPVVRRPRLPPGQPAVHLADVSIHRDKQAQASLAETIDQGMAFLGRHGIVGPMLIAVGHTGERLVESFDGGLMVSDRAFHLLPFERFRKFHRIRIWRALFSELLRQSLEHRALHLPARLVADAVAAALLDALIIERYGEAEWAPEMLESFAVIPEIDALIFAPQVPFADAYYEAIDETPRARIRPDDFDRSLPRGKLLHEKLVDIAGRSVMGEAAKEFLDSDAPWLDVVTRTIGHDAGAVLAPWLGPYPRLDYRLAEVRRDGDDLVVQIAADGPGAETVREPITVEVEDEDGNRHRTTRVGPGAARLSIEGEPERIELDPDHRLVEHVHPTAKGPRFNNRRPTRWRFLLNNITGLLAVTNGELTASADFTLRRIHDLRHRFDFLALYSPSSVGLATTASLGFGSELTPLRLAQRVGIAGAFERLRTEGGLARPGNQASLTLFYLYDSRLSSYWSFEGQGLSIRAVGAMSRDDLGRENRFIQGGVGAFHIFPFGFGHALLARLRADAQVGEAPPQNGLRLGGRYRGGRGFERDDARGELRLLASAEYRHIIESDARTDLFGLLTITRIEGGLFADTVHLPDARSRLRREGADAFLSCQRNTYYDVGYGLRFIADMLNVYPATVQVDLGLPLGRCRDADDDLPVAIYVAFLQSFISF